MVDGRMGGREGRTPLKVRRMIDVGLIVVLDEFVSGSIGFLMCLG